MKTASEVSKSSKETNGLVKALATAVLMVTLVRRLG